MQKRGKNPKRPKNTWLYRYRLVLYRYRLPSATFCTSCTVQVRPVPVHLFQFFIFFSFFLYGSIFIFLQIGNSSADVKSILVDCLPSRISLHAHLSPCLYSAQTDCVQQLTTVLSSLDTFTLTMGPTVFLVIRVPRV